MIFEALVINTDTFFERGTIVVRIPKFYLRKMQWDLTEDYPNFMNDNDEDAEGYTQDFEAFVYSPYGGGSNFGTFFLPQVNQRGIVMAMDKYLKKLIWMGSFFRPERNENWEVERVNYPSDDMNQEGPNGYGSLDGEQNLLADNLEEAKEKNFVARFKTTDKSSIEGLTWEDRPTSNIISIGDNAFFVTHFSKDEGWDDHTPKLWTTYSMTKDEDNNDITELKRTDVENEKEQRFALAFIDGKESFITEIKNNADSLFNTIIQQEDKTELKVTDESQTGTLTLTKDGIKLHVDDSGTEFSVNISAKDGHLKIVVDDDNIIELNDDGDLIINLENEMKMETGDNIIIEPGGTIQIGEGKSFVARYDELKSIIDKLEGHIHVAPTGPTTGPHESSMTPIPASIIKDKIDMESKKLETE